MIDFPASPTNGQVFTSGAQSWTWDGTKWVASGIAVMPPLSTGDNRLINGDMRIDQRWNGASGTAAGYTVDRWIYGASQPGKGSWGRNYGSAVVIQTGFLYYLGFQTASSPYTPAAAEAFQFNQKIEADMIGDFAFGQPNAQTVTLSFWAYSSLTGIFSGSISNDAGSRNYSFSYSLPTANVWTKIAVTIPGDTGGPWVLSGNALAMFVRFALGAGPSASGPAGAWSSSNFVGVTGAVNVLGTANAYFLLTGVKLEVGSVATPFPRQSLAKSMADCQRYYQQVGYTVLGGPNYTVSTGLYGTFLYPVVMRAAPTVVLSGQSYVNCSGLGMQSGPVPAQLTFVALATATGPANVSFNYTLSAEL